jgi:hypothetical protein
MVKESVFMEVEVELDDEFFDNIICTMLEGGSNYWIGHIIIKHPNDKKPTGMSLSEWASSAINNGGTILFYPDDENIRLTLSKRGLIQGLKDWMKSQPNEVSLINVNGKNTLDAGNIDAGIADKILQYALFSKLIYG